MTAQDRSTTHAVTDRRSRPALLVAAIVAVVALVLGWLFASHPAPPAVPSTAAAPSPALVVGDGRTVTLLSLGGPATDPVLDRVAADIGEAVARVEDFWGTDWSHDIVVVATATDAQFAAAAQATAAERDTAAVTVADAVDPARHQASGQRIVLAPGADRMSAGSLRIVLAHELFHYASRSATATDAPRWLTEGVADFVARPPAAVPPGQPLPDALPSDAEFTGAGSQLSSAYDRAWLFARFVAERYGVDALRTLYQRACGPGHSDPATAMRAVLGAGPDELLAGWRHWLG